MKTYRETYNNGVEFLKNSEIGDADIDARLLLEYVCGTDRNTLLAHPDREVSDTEADEYLKLLKKRTEHVPLQHILGTQDFMGLTFKVDGRVLIPRQDTECLVEEALTYIEDGMRVLDMCTGSGCILLSVMNYRNVDGVGCDYSEDALTVAKENAELLELKPVFLQGDMFETLGDEQNHFFDVILSNPPYIPKSVIPTLMSEVKEHDPMSALDGGEDGLDFYRIIAEKAPKYLTNYGRIYLEIGYDQGQAVSELLDKAGFSEIKVIKDYCDNDRVISAKYVFL